MLRFRQCTQDPGPTFATEREAAQYVVERWRAAGGQALDVPAQEGRYFKTAATAGTDGPPPPKRAAEAAHKASKRQRLLALQQQGSSRICGPAAVRPSDAAVAVITARDLVADSLQVHQAAALQALQDTLCAGAPHSAATCLCPTPVSAEHALQRLALNQPGCLDAEMNEGCQGSCRLRCDTSSPMHLACCMRELKTAWVLCMRQDDAVGAHTRSTADCRQSQHPVHVRPARWTYAYGQLQ